MVAINTKLFPSTADGQQGFRQWISTTFTTLYTGILSLLRYVITGNIVVDLCRLLVTTGGTIAESAFLLATVYVTINNVAHLILTWLLPLSTIATLNQISVIAFSVLPELIVASAIKVTVDHWSTAIKSGKKSFYFWAIAYTAPTTIFIGMTIITLASFVNVEAASSTAVSPQATGWMLVVRCLAGWTYGLLGMIFASIGKKTYAAHFDKMTSEHEKVRVSLSENAVSLQNLLSQKETDLLALSEKVALLEEQVTLSDTALREARLTLATQKVTRHRMPQETQESAIVEDDTVESDTAVMPTEKYQRLKECMRNAIQAGNKINMKRIAESAGVSYSTARKYAEKLVAEISAEGE